MTSNQIAYLNYLNTALSNERTAGIQRDAQIETVRHNVATELTANNSLAETSMHNRTSERIAFDTLFETRRNNVAQLAEINRHNMSTEESTRQMNAINDAHFRRQDATAQFSADTARSALAESMRHNMVTENISQQQTDNAYDIGWNNFAESQRHNKMSEILGDFQNKMRSHEVETGRMNAETARKSAQNGTFDSWTKALDTGLSIFRIRGLR